VKPFAYERAADVAGAIAAVTASPGAAFLGGGTNLVDYLKIGTLRHDLLVDVTGLPLDRVEDLPDGGLRIGAGVRNSDLAAHPAVRERYPVLSQAVLAGASGQLRNLATTGGNLLQRTRCLYFQDVSKPCNKREPGTGCPARDGEHRDLAVLGWSDACVATYPGDMAVALAALDATVRVTGPAGDRVIPLEELHRLPGDEPQRDSTLAHGELITAVDLPPLPLARRSSYGKARDRASFAFALASVAAALEIRDGLVADLRLAFGSVAHKPWRAHHAEEALRGAPATPESYARALDAELEQARPLRDNGFKIPLLRRMATAALDELAGGAA
jgi:xanthine dehydrogenase YagS FAD-binding subunit